MASKLYDKGRNHFLRGDIAWKAGGDTIRATWIDTSDYTVDLANHEFMNTDTVPSAARIATAALTLLDPVAGVARAEEGIWPGVTGDPFEALILWKDGGGGGSTPSGTTDLLIAFLDQDAIAELPVTPNGGDLHLPWDTGPNGIFKL